MKEKAVIWVKVKGCWCNCCLKKPPTSGCDGDQSMNCHNFDYHSVGHPGLGRGRKPQSDPHGDKKVCISGSQPEG